MYPHEQHNITHLKYRMKIVSQLVVGFSSRKRAGRRGLETPVIEPCHLPGHDLVTMSKKLVCRNLQFPSSEEQWRKIADGFHTRWQFPNGIGAIDGKHIVMQAVSGAGSEYFNYKGTLSIVMMAMVDANYCIIYVDIGCNAWSRQRWWNLA